MIAQAQRDDVNLSRLEMEVPVDQRPVNELKELKDSMLFSWATLDLTTYCQRLAILYGGVFAVLGGPIAFQTFDPARQPLEFFLSASTGSLLVVAAACVRLYIGWKYVADRLMTATLEYEESGWYDGQYFVKPPEILTRDRLLGTYEARPVMGRLRTTLQAVGGLLLANAIGLTVLLNTVDESSGLPTPTTIGPSGIIYSSKVKSMQELIADDEAAEAEAEAQGGIPGYCGSRYYKAYAGGEELCNQLAQRAKGVSSQ